MTETHEAAFEALAAAHRARLRLHCYRMLGSTTDAEDAVQETLLRAWRARGTLEDPSRARPWLVRIATNACLDALATRKRRRRGPDVGPSADPDAPPAAATPEVEWLEPCPASWLDGETPASAYTVKESVALAFLAALQVLTPTQRAVLLLRDVAELDARETAEALGTSVAAGESALHRARQALATRVGPREGWSPTTDAPEARAVLERYLRVWEAHDLDAIVALLRDDVVLSMPPHPTWVRGRDAVRRFLAHRLERGLAARLYRVVGLEANGQPAVAFYRRGDDGVHRFLALHVLEVDGAGVRHVEHFMGRAALGPFFAAGLPETA